MGVNFWTVFDHEGFEDIMSFNFVGVHDGILCIQYRNEDMVPRLLLSIPLTKRMRSISFPARVPDRCAWFSVHYFYFFPYYIFCIYQLCCLSVVFLF